MEILRLKIISGIDSRIAFPLENETIKRIAEWEGDRITDGWSDYCDLCLSLVEDYTSESIDFGSSLATHELAGWVSDFVQWAWDQHLDIQLTMKKSKLEKLKEEVERLQEEVDQQNNSKKK